MARTARIKADRDAYYHVMSRVTGGFFLLRDAGIKEAMLDALMRSAVFSGVDIAGFCIMDNHFHVACHVPAADVNAIPEDEVLRRVEVLSGRDRFESLMFEIESLRKRGDTEAVRRKIDGYRRRMHDLSQFMKTFLETFDIRFRKKTGFIGRLWCDRFKSVLIEDAEQMRRCINYIETNPLRAGLANSVEEYAWNTRGAARLGNGFAKACLEWFASMAGGDRPPEAWMMKKCAQMTAGKILGGAKFVERMLAAFAWATGSRHAMARLVVNGIYTSHGHRLAKICERQERTRRAKAA